MARRVAPASHSIRNLFHLRASACSTRRAASSVGRRLSTSLAGAEGRAGQGFGVHPLQCETRAFGRAESCGFLGVVDRRRHGRMRRGDSDDARHARAALLALHAVKACRTGRRVAPPACDPRRSHHAALHSYRAACQPRVRPVKMASHRRSARSCASGCAFWRSDGVGFCVTVPGSVRSPAGRRWAARRPRSLERWRLPRTSRLPVPRGRRRTSRSPTSSALAARASRSR